MHYYFKCGSCPDLCSEPMKLGEESQLFKNIFKGEFLKLSNMLEVMMLEVKLKLILGNWTFTFGDNSYLLFDVYSIFITKATCLKEITVERTRLITADNQAWWTVCHWLSACAIFEFCVFFLLFSFVFCLIICRPM